MIDYQSSRFEDEARDFDVVFDTVGSDTLRRSWAVLKTNSRLVTIASGSETPPDDRTKEAFFIVEPGRQQLVEIDECWMRVIFGQWLILWRHSLGLRRRTAEACSGTRRGKLVVVVVGPD